MYYYSSLSMPRLLLFIAYRSTIRFYSIISLFCYGTFCLTPIEYISFTDTQSCFNNRVIIYYRHLQVYYIILNLYTPSLNVIIILIMQRIQYFQWMDFFPFHRFESSLLFLDMIFITVRCVYYTDIQYTLYKICTYTYYIHYTVYTK